MASIRDALRLGRSRLEQQIDEAALEAELLLAHVLDKPRSHLFTWPEELLTDNQFRIFAELIQRRHEGTPVAYLLGSREFWSLPLSVTPDTLIPRPETELLVERALTHLNDIAEPELLDLGTGSGAIALALAHDYPGCRVSASERSAAALAVARANAQRLALTINWVEGAWLEPFTGRRFDLIVSNPPYIPESDTHLERGDLRFEPRSALAAGPEGLDDLRSIISQAGDHLKPGGWLLLEHGFDQAMAVRELLKANDFNDIYTCKDVAGRDRVSGGRY